MVPATCQFRASFSVRAICIALSSVCALCFLSVFGSSAADASCGDYLVTGKGLTTKHGGQMPAHDQAPHRADSNSTSDADEMPLRSKPCSGPQCRRNDPQPAMPVPPVPVTSTPHEAILIETTSLELTSLDRVLAEAAIGASVGCQSRLERPPRACDELS